MKITCQSCQAKYTIADEKIHGKVAKIRCRKCGETIEVDGTGLGAVAAEAPVDAVAPMEGGDEATWTVNLADDDQRTMTLGEILDGYRAGYITAETYLWADGMEDWAPLAEVPEIVAALGSDMPVAGDDAEPVRDSMFHESSYGASSDEPAAAVASSHGRVDLFGSAPEDDGGFPPPSDSATSTPQPLGARDEQSVLFSLSALTASAPKISVPPSSTGPTEDSGIIDLNALAAQAQEPAAKAEAEEPAPFLFPAALGSVEPVTKAATPEAAASAAPASKTPLFIGAGIAVAGLAIALVLASRPAEQPLPAAPSVTAAAAPPPVETAAPAPVATAAKDPAPVASAVTPEADAEDVKEASVKKPVAPKPAKSAKPAAPKPAKPAAPANTGATKPAAPASKKSNCGCAPADLQCQIRCSAMGK